MNKGKSHDERMAEMTFASVYPLYVQKIERKGRTVTELLEVIKWLTGYDEKQLQSCIDKNLTFKEFFNHANLHPDAELIKGVICGYRIEQIENPLTRKVRYLDKVVDELAKGRALEKIMRKNQ